MYILYVCDFQRILLAMSRRVSVGDNTPRFPQCQRPFWKVVWNPLAHSERHLQERIVMERMLQRSRLIMDQCAVFVQLFRGVSIVRIGKDRTGPARRQASKTERLWSACNDIQYDAPRLRTP